MSKSQSKTLQNMLQYGFSLTHISPYKNRIVDFILIREKKFRENLFSGIFYAARVKITSNLIEKTDKPTNAFSLDVCVTRLAYAVAKYFH